MNIALNVANWFPTDEAQHYNSAILVILNIEITRQFNTGGSFLSFDATSMELFYGDISIAKYAISEPLVNNIREILSVYIAVIPPLSSVCMVVHEECNRNERMLARARAS